MLERVLPEAWGGIAAGVAYALAYVAASVAFRAWRSEDLAVLSGLAGRYPRLGGLAGAWAARLAARGSLS